MPRDCSALRLERRCPAMLCFVLWKNESKNEASEFRIRRVESEGLSVTINTKILNCKASPTRGKGKEQGARRQTISYNYLQYQNRIPMVSFIFLSK